MRLVRGTGLCGGVSKLPVPVSLLSVNCQTSAATDIRARYFDTSRPRFGPVNQPKPADFLRKVLNGVELRGPVGGVDRLERKSCKQPIFKEKKCLTAVSEAGISRQNDEGQYQAELPSAGGAARS